MSINIGSPRALAEPDLIVDINTTPLIDVMLVLLIMLIITIPTQLHAVNLDMPVGNLPPPSAPPEVVQIEVDPSGSIFWNGDLIQNSKQLNEKFRQVAHESVQPEIHVKPNKLAPYKSVAVVMASAQRNHAKKIGIVGNEQYI